MVVQGIILAGAHVWDDQAFDAVIPRPLLPVLGTPLIHHTLRWLRRGGVRRVTICTNQDAAALWKALGDGRRFDVDIHYYIDHSPRGPGGCLRDAFYEKEADAAVLIEGSVVPTFPLSDVLLAHYQKKAALTVVGEAARDGSAGVRPSGCFVASDRAIREIPDAGYQDVKEMLVPRLIAQELTVRLVSVSSPTLRVRDLDSYLDVHEALLGQMRDRREELPGFHRFGSVWVQSSAWVSSHATLVGPLIIGPRSRIEGGAVLVGPGVVGAGCRLWEGSVATRSVLLDGAAIGAGGRADASLLFPGAGLRSGRLRHAILVPDGQARVDERAAVVSVEAPPVDTEAAMGHGGMLGDAVPEPATPVSSTSEVA